MEKNLFQNLNIDKDEYFSFVDDDSQSSCHYINEQSNITSKRKQNYHILTINQIYDRFIEIVQNKIMPLICKDFDQSIKVFQQWKWRYEFLEQNYFKENEKEDSQSTQEKVIQQEKLKECPCCLDDGNELIKLKCGDQFCENCLRQFIEEKIQNQIIKIRCLKEGCLRDLDFSIIQKYCQDEQKFKKTVSQIFTQVSDKFIWCPQKDCIYCIEKIENKFVDDVRCKCGNTFCFKCGQEAHFPNPCHVFENWQKQMKSSDLNDYWISVNTKSCPFCKKQVQKSFGCDFMLCSPPGGCGQSFCYICEQPWNDESVPHGRCQAKKKSQKKVDIIQKVNFYSDRYYRYQKEKQVFEDKFKIQMQIYQRDLKEMNQFTDKDLFFITVCIEELLLSRKILQQAHIFAFNLDVQKNFNFKENLHLQIDNYEDKADDLIQQMYQKIVQLIKLALIDKDNIIKSHHIYQQYLKFKNEIKNTLKLLISYKNLILDMIENF